MFGDFNCPGDNSLCIDGRLESVFDIHAMKLHVSTPTRHDYTGRENILNLVVTTTTLHTISNVSVESVHGMSDHHLVRCSVGIRRTKLPPTQYTYRDLKKINLTDLKNRLQCSNLLSMPVVSTETYAENIQSAVSEILSIVAPLRTGHRPNNGRRDCRWLSAEAVEIRKTRRKLERRWKFTGHESDKVEYRNSCHATNHLIIESRHRENQQVVNEAAGNA